MKLLYMAMLVFAAGACMAHSPDITSLPEEPDCADISASAELDDCMHEAIETSRTLLSDELVSFEKRARHVYAADQMLGQEFIDMVLEAQNAWVEFRDKSCKVDAFEVEKGAPSYVTTVNGCIIRMNMERVEVLESLLR
ncbi:lysozyme inhibitor LprI family protein [Halopseudomonas salegens]|uniref:Uncharacterized conserved protein YecT, DUF1311 family n=1 Tax=Halopseudomonas salegens TaxID=1434072 RepID=A0A1H2HXK6_9GAMM|nr:lysozyme inhibitor LprI family protein [Halopseudomonas salegens]SDU36663.1 Uncharacterized conserved protein YecT, DUF1311 family [Halopseudomonas salegens]